MTEKENEELVKNLFNLLNRMGNDKCLAKAISKHIETAHRTLVQNFFRCVSMVIDGYAKHKHYDGRNVDSLMWAKDVARLDAYFPHV